jgi:hypothetical protein
MPNVCGGKVILQYVFSPKLWHDSIKLYSLDLTVIHHIVVRELISGQAATHDR